MTEPQPFVGVVTAEVVGRAEHPADLTPEQKAHLGLPPGEPDDQRQQQQEEGR